MTYDKMTDVERQIEGEIIAELERVAPLSGSELIIDYETGCVDFAGTFRPIEMARRIAALQSAAPVHSSQMEAVCRAAAIAGTEHQYDISAAPVEDDVREVKAISYDHLQEIAAELGYPSPLEALEQLERLSSTGGQGND